MTYVTLLVDLLLKYNRQQGKKKELKLFVFEGKLFIHAAVEQPCSSAVVRESVYLQ